MHVFGSMTQKVAVLVHGAALNGKVIAPKRRQSRLQSRRAIDDDKPGPHIPPRNTGDRPPLEPWQNIVLVVVQVDDERAWLPVPPVIREYLVGDRLESDYPPELCGDTFLPFGVGIADPRPAAAAVVLRLQGK